MATTFRQKTAFGPGTYRGHKFSIERLKQYAEGTNKAIAAGVPVPLLKRHAVINADDAVTANAAHLDGAGWLSKVDVESDGSLAWEFKDVSPECESEIQAGRMKFTSPEFRDFYKSEKEGVYEGPIIRHVAITPLPGNPHQGDISPMEAATKELSIALQEQHACLQLSEDEREESPALTPDAAPISPNPNAFTPTKGKKVKVSRGQFVGKTGTVTDITGTAAMVHMDDMGNHDHSINFNDLEDFQGTDVADSGAATDPDDDSDTDEGATENTQHAEGGSKKPKNFPPAEGNEAETEGAPELVVEESPIGADPALAGMGGGLVPDAMSPGMNPDMPPVATDRSKLAAVVAGLGQLGIVLPSDFDLMNPASIDLLLTGINTCVKAKNDAEVKEAEQAASQEQGAPITDAAMPYSEQQVSNLLANLTKQLGITKLAKVEGKRAVVIYTAPSVESAQFTESELKALPPKVQAALEAANKLKLEAEAGRKAAELQASQHAEAEAKAVNAAALKDAKQAVSAATLPPNLKKQLLAVYEGQTVQFSEGKDQPVYTAQQVAVMVAAALPKTLLFPIEEATLSTGEPEQFFEKGTGNHLSDEQAEAVVAKSPLVNQRWQPPGNLNQFVETENNRNPNGVMRKR